MPPTGPASDPASLDELRALQLERLRRTLRHVYENVPFYRAKFDEAGADPAIAALADLAKFPLTAKADLRDNYPTGLLAVPRDQIRRIHASSGTTGKPTVVAYTQRDLDVWAEVVARSISAAGGRPGQLVHIAYGYGLFTGGLGAHYGAERLGCAVVPASGGATARQVQLIADLRPEIIMVTPTYMLTLLDEFERQGLDPAASSLRVGIFGAEPWTEAMRAEIESRAGIDAVDIYGLSEVIGPGVAQESAVTKDGLHLWEDHFYPEIVDPVSGDPLPDGERGELVLTTLTKEGMPVIRYRTRDLTRLWPGSQHAPFRRMEKVTGRSDDMIILRGVNVFPTQIEEIVLRVPGLAPHFQLLLTREARMDRLTVLAEGRPDAGRAALDAAPALITDAVKDTIGVTVAAEIVEPGRLERSTGKMRRVLDRRGL
ncbi:MAG TPA: phenylacetate--CoA ligase PaaK [Trebonia sp.]|jgi:phenylacetate-CoA ligase|nr:phenylacetate--CoA ligase PaaK [Trebonia sp.]